MALLSRGDHHFRPVNKEPEWSSICNNVFDQYLDHDDIFAFDADQRGRTSSNDSCNLFDFSGSSEQSHQTDATSPMPSWEPAAPDVEIEKQHPKSKAPVDFWQKTVKALEQNAAACELRQQKLRTTKSHPDFLSLGGHPSPPALHSSPTDQSFSAQRRVSRSLAANGKKRNITARSSSRGRPSGVSKATVAGSVNPYATVRKCSASPAKMMNPSRYRAGFKDVWSEKLHTSPEKYGIRVPSAALPFSPPPSGRDNNDDDGGFAVFGSPTAAYSSFAGYDEQLSPLANTFQHAHIHTPIASPGTGSNAAAHARNGYFDPVPPVPPNPYAAAQKVPLNDTAPLFPERTSSLAPHKIQDFDFGFDTSLPPDPFSPSSFGGALDSNYITSQTNHFDPFGSGIDASVLPTTETVDFGSAGLGISCDPSSLISPQPYVSLAETSTATVHPSSTISQHPYNNPHPHRHYRGQSVPAPHYPYNTHQHQQPLHGLPTTPRRGRTHSRTRPRARSPSPSPTPHPTTCPRPSKHRNPSTARHHRRTKSASTTPHAHQRKPSSSAGGGGGFVNFTPHDSSKILSGVAPSGSSKTKARREKEAADKRRRLSQAAVKAVVDAGGDLGVLEREGLVGAL